VGAGVVLLVALVAVIVWVLASHLRPTGWDSSLHEYFVHHRTTAVSDVTKAVSITSEYIAYVFAAVGTMLALLPRPWWLGLIAGILLMSIGQGIRVGVAALFGRDRPPHGDWVMHAAGYSFPSGHTATATLAAGILCLGLFHWTRHAMRWVALVVLVAWVLLEGIGRVYLGVHWPTDVLSGWLLGALLTVLVALLFARLRPGPQRAEPGRRDGVLSGVLSGAGPHAGRTR
jgi:undecaprenyl-diphosphatase